MANPQPSDAHLRIAHSINEQLMVSYFTEQQRRILDLILRLSWGCGKKDAIIPAQRDFELVGIGEGHVKAHLDWLIEAKVITREESMYAFNKNFDEWRVSRAFKFSQEKLTELVRLNLNGTYGKGKIELTEKVNSEVGNLPKREGGAYGKGKLPMPELASSKEILKKDNIYIYNIPDWIDKDVWDSFLEMRRKKKSPPTEKAKELLIKELEKLRLAGDDPTEVLNQSIMRNYTGVFPLSKGGQNGKYKGNPSQKPAGAFSDIEQ